MYLTYVAPDGRKRLDKSREIQKTSGCNIRQKSVEEGELMYRSDWGKDAPAKAHHRGEKWIWEYPPSVPPDGEKCGNRRYQELEKRHHQGQKNNRNVRRFHPRTESTRMP